MSDVDWTMIGSGATILILIFQILVIYIIAPLYKLSGKFSGIVSLVESHEERIQSLEKRGYNK